MPISDVVRGLLLVLALSYPSSDVTADKGRLGDRVARALTPTPLPLGGSGALVGPVVPSQGECPN